MVAWSLFESLTWGSTLKVQKLFVEESNAFSKSENHIGQIESLKLKVNVTNPTRVSTTYRKTPTQLYSEVK